MKLHRANGAHWAEENGWLLPAHFGDPLKEYQSVRSQVGLLDLSHRVLLRFTGSDRVPYLQGMVSNDVESLTPGEGTCAAILDVHGKIQADVRVFCAEDFFLMDCWEPLKERVVAHLNRYLIADDVEIKDLAEEYGILSLQGPNSQAILEQFSSPGAIPSKELNHSMIGLVESEIRLI
jgi:glycine cleavage system aminomethyltransferase T